MSIVSFGYATSAGMVRKNNEDSLCLRPDIGLWAVADGMGGYRGGETASRIAVEQLSEDVAADIPLSNSISRIHRRIIDVSSRNPAYASMGSTIAALKTDGKEYEIAWVGDSRAYLWKGERLTRLTRDHSYVQVLVDSGRISASEALDHPDRNVITQALGAREIREVDVGRIRGSFDDNEKILLCSDGLTNEVDDSRIASILEQSSLSEQILVDRLMAAAKKNGGSDNISAILVGVDNALPEKKAIRPSPGNPSGASRKEEKIEDRSFWFLMVIVFLLLLVSVVVLYDIL